MKILIRIPVWKRYELTEAILEKTIEMISMVSQKYGYQFELLILYSENEYKKSPYFHHKLFTWLWTDNDHLGRKLNQGLQYAIDNMTFDYMLELGSDDVILPGAWDIYHSALERKLNCFGFTDVEIREWVGPGLAYNRKCVVRFNQVIGAGRFFSHSALLRASKHVKVMYKKTYIAVGDNSHMSGNQFQIRNIPAHSYNSIYHEIQETAPRYILWDEEVTMGNDITAERRIKQAGFNVHALPGPFIIDYKTEDNLQGYDWLVSRVESF